MRGDKVADEKKEEQRGHAKKKKKRVSNLVKGAFKKEKEERVPNLVRELVTGVGKLGPNFFDPKLLPDLRVF